MIQILFIASSLAALVYAAPAPQVGAPGVPLWAEPPSAANTATAINSCYQSCTPLASSSPNAYTPCMQNCNSVYYPAAYGTPVAPGSPNAIARTSCYQTCAPWAASSPSMYTYCANNCNVAYPLHL
ncbi:hypothetical protein SeMB42_g05268 [Synchytrium endobioticum]|uniref:Uncharacterized protein n=1 Tax=Synchytrium endobioticum TaxID=286115 RepID=A0A507DHN2_9FUNG|nr:hypothetical protein SeMB42_g05268 [Synchytrium endobioticum]TPX51083.1 hypothetical protein SeLEV6574_g00512 [Synchytrium endobioticum]